MSGFQHPTFWFVHPQLSDKDIDKQIETFVRSGVDSVIIGGGGHHYLHNDLPNMQQQIAVTQKIVKLCHAQGIKVCEHHSSVLTGENVFAKEHEAWLMKSFSKDGSASVWPEYQTRSFCPNNLEFRESYWQILSDFVKSTGVDAVMSDDACFYQGCSCSVCAKKWQEQTGGDIRKAYAESRIVGSPQWREWNSIHRGWMDEYWRWLSGKLKKEFPNVLCLGLVGSITGPWTPQNTLISAENIMDSTQDVLWEIYNPADFYSWRRISTEAAVYSETMRLKGTVVSVLPYADNATVRDVFDPEEEVFMWGLAKAYGMPFVLSRVFLTGLEKNADVRPYWNFEKQYPDCFVDSNIYAPIGILFSGDSRNTDPAGEAYHTVPYTAWGSNCLDNYIPWRAVNDETLDKGIPKDIKILVAPNVFAISDSRLMAIEEFVARGGTLVATFLTGTCDQTGKDVLNQRRKLLESLFGVRINTADKIHQGIDTTKIRPDMVITDSKRVEGSLEAYIHNYKKGHVIYIPELFESAAFQDYVNEGNPYKGIPNPDICASMSLLLRKYIPDMPVSIEALDVGSQLITIRKDKAGRYLIHVLNAAGSNLTNGSIVLSPSKVVWSKPGWLTLKFSKKMKSVQVISLDNDILTLENPSLECRIQSPKRYELIIVQE